MTTRRVLNDVDWDVTWTNGLTTGIMTAGQIPVYANTDEDAVRMCIRCLHNVDYSKARVVHIKNTLAMSTIEVSKALYDSIKELPGISYVSGPVPMEFHEDGSLVETQWP